VCNEPSVVAVHKDSRGARRILAIGAEAKKMLGRTPDSIVAIRPLKDGVIADFEITESMLRHFIKKAHKRKLLAHPRIVIAVHPGADRCSDRLLYQVNLARAGRHRRLAHRTLLDRRGTAATRSRPLISMV
jgi:rod shape-determining protein MreB